VRSPRHMAVGSAADQAPGVRALSYIFEVPSDEDSSDRIESPVFLRFQNRRVLAIGR